MKLAPDRQFMTLTDLLNNANKIPFRLGEIIEVASTGARYKIQADSVEGYNVDNVAVIPVASNYAVLQAKNKEYKTEWWGNLESGSLIWNSAGKFAFLTTKKGINRVSGSYSDSTISRGNKVILSQPLIIKDQIYLQTNVVYEGYSSNINVDDNILFPSLILDFSNSQDTALVLLDRSQNINVGSANQYCNPSLRNINIEVISDLHTVIALHGAMGDVLDNVVIEGNDFTAKGITYDYGIFAKIKNTRIENCDTSIHVINGPVSTSTSTLFENITSNRSKYGIVIDENAGTQFEFRKLFVETWDSIGVVIGKDNDVYFNNFESENGGRTPEPHAIFLLQGDVDDNRTSVSIRNARLGGQSKYTFDVEGAYILSISDSWLAGLTGSVNFIRGTQYFDVLNISSFRMRGAPGGSSDQLYADLNSDLHSSTIRTVLSTTYNDNKVVNFHDEVTAGTFYLKNGSNVFLTRSMEHPPVIRYDNPANGGIYKAPLALSTTQELGSSYHVDKNIYTELYPRGNTKLENIYSEILVLGLTENQTTGLFGFSSVLDIRNSTYNILDLYSYKATTDFPNGVHSGTITNTFGFLAELNADRIGGENRNIINVGGIHVKDHGRDLGTNNTVENSYGLLIENQTFDANNTYSIYTGLGPVHLGDSLYVAGNFNVDGDIYGVTNPMTGTNTVQASLDSLKTYADQSEADAETYAVSQDINDADYQDWVGLTPGSAQADSTFNYDLGIAEYTRTIRGYKLDDNRTYTIELDHTSFTPRRGQVVTIVISNDGTNTNDITFTCTDVGVTFQELDGTTGGTKVVPSTAGKIELIYDVDNDTYTIVDTR